MRIRGSRSVRIPASSGTSSGLNAVPSRRRVPAGSSPADAWVRSRSDAGSHSMIDGARAADHPRQRIRDHVADGRDLDGRGQLVREGERRADPVGVHPRVLQGDQEVERGGRVVGVGGEHGALRTDRSVPGRVDGGQSAVPTARGGDVHHDGRDAEVLPARRAVASPAASSGASPTLCTSGGPPSGAETARRWAGARTASPARATIRGRTVSRSSLDTMLGGRRLQCAQLALQ